MKPVFFSEDQFNNLDEIIQAAFEDSQDPRSSSYIRKLNRPVIRWIRIIFNISIPVLAFAFLIWGLIYVGFSTALSFAVSITILLIYIIVSLKKAVICLIKIYQRYAPDSMRNKCRFEPSCSEYMVLSIQKYGLIKGLKKGISRLKRCNVDGGGFDFP